MTSKTGKPAGTRTTQTQYRLSVLAKFIEENGRVPTVEEVQEMLEIDNPNTARNYLKMIKASIPKPESILGEIQENILQTILSRVKDTSNPMIDSDRIKLLEFFLPKKSEVKQTIEDKTIIGEDELDELEQYEKLLGEPKAEPTPTL